MSMDSREQSSMPARWKLVLCGAAALLAVGMSSQGAVIAQDASPVAAECDAPELPPGTPTPMEEASPAAMEGMDMATPMAEATEEATEEAPAEVDSGTPAEGDEATAITAAVENIVGCVNGGDYQGAAALMTENFMLTEFGTANPYDVALFIEGFMFANATVDNPLTYEDGSVSADVTFNESPYQLSGERFILVQDGDYWKVDASPRFTPEYEGDSATVGVALREVEGEDGTRTYAFEIAGNVDPTVIPTVAQQEVLVLHGTNFGVEAHEIVVVKLPEGADPSGILDGTIAEEDVEFVGFVELAPGEQVDMVLLGVPAGVYTMVCFFPAPDGTPHAMRGMVAQFEVTAPAS